MKQFEIVICRIPTQHCVIRLAASTREEAEQRAIAIAGDQDFQTSDVDYQIQSVTERVGGDNNAMRRLRIADDASDGVYFRPVIPIVLWSALHTVLEMAEAHVADIESGISEGLYESKSNSNLVAKQAAIKTVREQLPVAATDDQTDHSPQTGLREVIEQIARETSVDDVCALTPYALQRLEAFGNLFCSELQKHRGSA